MFQLTSVTKGSQDRHSSQEPGSRNWSKDHVGTLLTGLIPMAGSLAFLSTAYPGVAQPIVAWAPPTLIFSQDSASIDLAIG